MYNGILSSEIGLSQPGFEHQYCSKLLLCEYVNEFQGFFRNQTCTVRLCQTEADPVTFLKDLNFLLCIKLNFSYGRVLKITQILRASFIIPRQGLEGQDRLISSSPGSATVMFYIQSMPRRYMAEILLIRRKTLSTQSIKHAQKQNMT